MPKLKPAGSSAPPPPRSSAPPPPRAAAPPRPVPPPAGAPSLPSRAPPRPGGAPPPPPPPAPPAGVRAVSLLAARVRCSCSSLLAADWCTAAAAAAAAACTASWRSRCESKRASPRITAAHALPSRAAHLRRRRLRRPHPQAGAR
ncbi:hypothetical protein FA09DRAFT_34734 [Tilletiopsis washingtonensis]|uniref:Uncharacterized protein n=1 Tax=Tilletiopsis washingtonensis TaxID=58919 RepID=A0A316Z8S7_9BASI|nr:hypothetical protein FA09DRAFT_34734 [Tilletiopsis washingtonensis]PWN97981.1 hypothetical protein FA09DRAFT_34734 [Tilletiopsis washingtonensis]